MRENMGGAVAVVWRKVRTQEYKLDRLKEVVEIESDWEAVDEAINRILFTDEIHRMFVTMVGDRRALGPEELRPLVDGRVFTGAAAVRNRLIDAIGGEAEARAWLTEDRNVDPDLPVRDVKPARDVARWLQFLDALDRKTMISERQNGRAND